MPFQTAWCQSSQPLLDFFHSQLFWGTFVCVSGLYFVHWICIILNRFSFRFQIRPWLRNGPWLRRFRSALRLTPRPASTPWRARLRFDVDLLFLLKITTDLDLVRLERDLDLERLPLLTEWDLDRLLRLLDLDLLLSLRWWDLFLELFLEREVDFDRRCCFGDIDLRSDFRLGWSWSGSSSSGALLTFRCPARTYFSSLGLSFSVLFSILGIMSGNSWGLPTPHESLSSDFEVWAAERTLYFHLKVSIRTQIQNLMLKSFWIESQIFSLCLHLCFFSFLSLLFLSTLNKHRGKKLKIRKKDIVNNHRVQIHWD